MNTRQPISKKKIATKLLLFLFVSLLMLQLILPVTANTRYFAGDAEAYRQSLVEMGFPNDYAIALTELHLLHPTWTFSPLLITEQKPTYTWNYVLDQEMKDPESNIIYSASSYASYHHPTNKNLYDSGYYQVSRETLAYFMDPRNFLNETDIFQFYALSGANPDAKDSVTAILKGTFMENAVLENGKSYAEYFIEIGNELGINPIFLATKVRQEQGTNGTSPLISGSCGTKLWEFYENKVQVNDAGNEVLSPESGYTEEQLLALDGYFNFFNVKAMGNGLFSIYYNAMTYAANGTASMAEQWGGSGAWNTRWKALYGGAYFLKNNYIDRYQSTVYLQKFNVDSRADGNFAYQYMASVFGALSESRVLYQSFAALNALDAPAHFQIPVYEGMPTEISPDPAGGTVSLTAKATEKYDIQSEMIAPARLSAKNMPLYTTSQVYSNADLSIEGVVTHTYALNRLEYAWDGGTWHELSTSKTFQESINCHFSENTSHILVIRGTTSYEVKRAGVTQTIYSHFIYAVIYVEVIPRPNATVTYEVGNTQTEHTYPVGAKVTLPVSEASDFAGWIGSDGSFLPSGAEIEIRENLAFSAVFLNFDVLEGAALVCTDPHPQLRFSAVIDEDGLAAIKAVDESAISISASFTENGTVLSDPVLSKKPFGTIQGNNLTRLDLHTDLLNEEQYSKEYQPSFLVVLRYSNGETKTMLPESSATPRTAKQVALSALADSTVRYSAQITAILQKIAAYS